MKKSQVTDSNINVVQKAKEEITMESNSKILENQEKHEQVNVAENQEVEEKAEMPFEMAKRIVQLANKGFELTKDCKELNPLFAGIFNSCNDELLPKVEKLTDFENLTDDLKNAGDILAKIIGYADKGFTLTDVPDDLQPFSEVHLLFSEILMIGLEVRVGTHTMRKTFGYHHYQKFKDVVLLQKIFNHSSPQITLRYIGIEQDQIDYSYNNFIL